MKYYIDTIEQVKGENDALTEYGARTRKNDMSSALTEFYQKLSNVAADLGKGHTYMDIKIVNSEGGIVKKDQVGSYINDED